MRRVQLVSAFIRLCLHAQEFLCLRQHFFAMKFSSVIEQHMAQPCCSLRSINVRIPSPQSSTLVIGQILHPVQPIERKSLRRPWDFLGLSPARQIYMLSRYFCTTTICKMIRKYPDRSQSKIWFLEEHELACRVTNWVVSIPNMPLL